MANPTLRRALPYALCLGAAFAASAAMAETAPAPAASAKGARLVKLAPVQSLHSVKPTENAVSAVESVQKVAPDLAATMPVPQARPALESARAVTPNEVATAMPVSAESAVDLPLTAFAPPGRPDAVAVIAPVRVAPTQTAIETASAATAVPAGPKAATLAEEEIVRPAAATSLDGLIARYAETYDVPEKLVRRVVKRESNFRPEARNGPYWGLMQIRHDTAKGMGYRGHAAGLLDAETNLKYAVKYLKGAYLTARGNHDQAVRFYARGYYYDAKRRGLLEETGLRASRKKEVETAVADAEPQRKVIEAKPALPGVAPMARPATAAAFAGATPSTSRAAPAMGFMSQGR